MKKTIFTILIFLLPIALFAQDGVLDPTFGSSGTVTTSIGSFNVYGYGIAIQADGKIVVVGAQDNVSSSDFLVVRYNVDGTLDNSFDTDGIKIIDFGGGYDVARSLVIQTNGKIIVVGHSGNSIALARLNTDGTLDVSFDTDGKVLTSSGKAYSVALQTDGKIVVAGNITTGGVDDDFVVVRYNANGSLDTTFDTDGIVTTNIIFWYDFAKSLAVQSDGKIIVAGDSRNGGHYDIAVVRYNSDGSLDTSFDSDGIVTTDVMLNATQANDLGYSVLIQSDGKIVVGGTSSNNGDYFTVVRLNIDGSLDVSFDSDGLVNVQNGFGKSLAMQSDGKFIIAGYSTLGTGNPRKFELARINNNGSIDGSFGSSGKVTTAIGSSSSEGHGVIVQLDGKIIVAGQSYNGSNYVLALARYNNPSLPVELTTFTASILRHAQYGESSAKGTVSVELNWETATEVNNYGFEIEKHASSTLSMKDDFIPSGVEGWEKIAFVQGHGNSNSPKFYSFLDNSISSGKYNYRLKQIDIDGSYEYSDIVEVDLGLPSEFELSQNYPNPFNPITTIKYSLPVIGTENVQSVQLIVYDILGKKVVTLVNEQKASGNYKVEFNASNLSSGLYFYTLKTEKFVETKKMLLMK